MSAGTDRTKWEGESRLIDTQSDLESFCQSLDGVDMITVDTEFMRESTFWPKLCLLQIAGPEIAAAIDPLAPDISLAPVHRVLCDESVLKVFHAARQDLEIFFLSMGRLPAPIFDTQIAAMVCGFGDSVSYEILASKLAGFRIDKSSRFTDWSLRPLSPRQIDYALSDVTHLRTVYAKLARRLSKNGRTAWLEEEVRTLTANETYELEPRNAYRRIKSRSNNSRVLAVLREVAAWREAEAQRRDVPRNRVIRDESIAEIAHHAPQTVNELARTRGLSHKVAEGPFGQAILKSVTRGLLIPEIECPQPAVRRESFRDSAPLADVLKLLLKVKCAEAGVAQRLVATSGDVERIAALGDEAETPALNGWRRKLFGEDALRLRVGEMAIAVRDAKVTLVPVAREPTSVDAPDHGSPPKTASGPLG